MRVIRFPTRLRDFLILFLQPRTINAQRIDGFSVGAVLTPRFILVFFVLKRNAATLEKTQGSVSHYNVKTITLFCDSFSFFT